MVPPDEDGLPQPKLVIAGSFVTNDTSRSARSAPAYICSSVLPFVSRTAVHTKRTESPAAVA
jgi:hypothetical protein